MRPLERVGELLRRALLAACAILVLGCVAVLGAGGGALAGLLYGLAVEALVPAASPAIGRWLGGLQAAGALVGSVAAPVALSRQWWAMARESHDANTLNAVRRVEILWRQISR